MEPPINSSMNLLVNHKEIILPFLMNGAINGQKQLDNTF